MGSEMEGVRGLQATFCESFIIFVCFRYYFGKPCVLLKMNLVYDWIPDPYTIEEVRNHTTMPKL